MQCKRKKLDLVFCPRRVCKPCNGGKVLRCNWVLFSQTLSHTAHTAVGLGLKAWLSLPVKPTSHQRGMKQQIANIFHILKVWSWYLRKPSNHPGPKLISYAKSSSFFSNRFAMILGNSMQKLGIFMFFSIYAPSPDFWRKQFYTFVFCMSYPIRPPVTQPGLWGPFLNSSSTAS